MSSKTRQQLESWIKEKTLHGQVLDIGGSQLPIEKRAKFVGEQDLWILDLPQPHEEKVKPDLVWDLNDRLTLDSDFERMDLFHDFDSAVCLEVSEYWYDPVTALKNIALFLKRGGSLFISFHFVYPVHNPVAQDTLRYTPQGAIRLLEACGYEIVESVPRKADSLNMAHFYREEGMRPARDWPRHDEVGVLIEARKK